MQRKIYGGIYNEERIQQLIRTEFKAPSEFNLVKDIFSAAKNNNFAAVKSNDFAVVRNVIDKRYWSVLDKIRKNDDLRKALVATVIENAATDFIDTLFEGMFSDRYRYIFTHADYEAAYAGINKIQNDCYNEITYATNHDTPQDVRNLIIEHIKIVESGSRDFTLKLFKRYTWHLSYHGDASQLKQLLDDSHIHMTADAQVDYMNFCQTSFYTETKDGLKRLIDLMMDEPSKLNVTSCYRLHQLYEMLTHINHSMKEKEEVTNDFTYNIEDVIRLEKKMFLKLIDSIINVAKPEYTHSNGSSSLRFFCVHENQFYIDKMLEDFLNKIASNLPKITNIFDRITHLFNSLHAAYKNKRLPFSVVDALFALLVLCEDMGICQSSKRESSSSNDRDRIFTLTETFNNLKKIFDQHLSQIEENKTKSIESVKTFRGPGE